MFAHRIAMSAARIFAVLPLLSASIFTMGPSVAHAWGAMGHRVVAKVASDLTTDGSRFWGNNQESLEAFANTPDNYWKNGSSSAQEKPTHYFHFDYYSPDHAVLPTLFEVYDDVVERYTKAVVLGNGTAIWRVEQMFLLAREALAAGRLEEGLQWAGAMAHYVGDLSQPLHVAQNYDGQLSGQKGIHAWFETTNLATIDESDLQSSVLGQARELIATPAFQQTNDGSVMHGMLLEAARSSESIHTVLDNDARLGRRSNAARDAQLSVAQARLADGAATYALLLSRLWRESGRVDSSTTLRPVQPLWRAPDYSQRAFCE